MWEIRKYGSVRGIKIEKRLRCLLDNPFCQYAEFQTKTRSETTLVDLPTPDDVAMPLRAFLFSLCTMLATPNVFYIAVAMPLRAFLFSL